MMIRAALLRSNETVPLLVSTVLGIIARGANVRSIAPPSDRTCAADTMVASRRRVLIKSEKKVEAK